MPGWEEAFKENVAKTTTAEDRMRTALRQIIKACDDDSPITPDEFVVLISQIATRGLGDD